MNAVAVCLGMALGNFVYQWLSGERKWKLAVERSYFMAFAVGIYWCVK